MSVIQGQFTLDPYLIVEALTEVDAIAIHPTSLTDFIGQSTSFSHGILKHLGHFTNLLLALELFYDDVDSYSKVCSYLYLSITTFPNDSSIICLNQEEIASIVGLKRVQVARVLAELRNENIVSTKRNQIQVLDVEKLRERSVGFVLV